MRLKQTLRIIVVPEDLKTDFCLKSDANEKRDSVADVYQDDKPSTLRLAIYIDRCIEEPRPFSSLFPC